MRATYRKRQKQNGNSVAVFSVSPLSPWEKAGVRATDRKRQKQNGNSVAVFSVSPLSPWERAGVRASDRRRQKHNASSVAVLRVFSLSRWERAGVRASGLQDAAPLPQYISLICCAFACATSSSSGRQSLTIASKRASSPILAERTLPNLL